MLFLKEKVKTVDFSETIAASDLKASRNRHQFSMAVWNTIDDRYMYSNFCIM